MLNTRGVHIFKKDKKANRWYHAETHPIQWFVSAETRIAVQDGKFFTAGGVELKRADVPAWVLEAVGRLTPSHRASLGLKDPEPRKAVN